MARIVINNNSVEPLGGPNLGLSTEQGDSWNTTVANLNTMFTEIYGGGAFLAGGSTATFKTGGNIGAATVVGPVGSSATNTTQTLASYTMPASMFNANGQMLEITAWGNVAANAAPKTIAMKAGGVQLTTGTQTGSGYAWELYGQYMRTAASKQSAYFTGQASGGIVTQTASTDTSVDTGTIAVTVTCADASAAQSNVLLFGFTVEYFG